MKLKGSAFRSGLFKGYTSTYVVEILVLISNLLVYRLCTFHFGNEGLADISVYKRIFAFIQPLLLMGLLIGITRFVAQTFDKKNQFHYFFTSFVFMGSISVLVLIVMNGFSSFISELLFDDLRFEKYILPLSISIAGVYFHLMIYGYLRGKHNFMEANILQFLNMALIPVLAFYWSNTLKDVLLFTGALWCLISCTYFIILLIRQNTSQKLFFDFNKLKVLLRFGIPRIPGDVAFGGLFALPVIIVSHFHSPEIAGRLAFSLTLLNIVGAAFSPLSLMLLPTISQKLKENKLEEVNKQIKNAIIVTVLLSGLGVLIYQIFANQILTLYLGSEIEPWIEDTKIVMLGGVFYALFITMRSVIDAYHYKAVNSLNILISVAIFCVSAVLFGAMNYDYIWFYFGFLLSLFVLTTLTLISIYKIQHALKFDNQ